MKEVQFVNENGQMAHALGVSPERNAQIEATVKGLIEKGATLRGIVEHVRDTLDLNPNEWSSFMYALGHWDASRAKEEEQPERTARNLAASDFFNSHRRLGRRR